MRFGESHVEPIWCAQEIHMHIGALRVDDNEDNHVHIIMYCTISDSHFTLVCTLTAFIYILPTMRYTAPSALMRILVLVIDLKTCSEFRWTNSTKIL